MVLGVILVCATTLLQTHTPPAVLGRVSSVALAAVGLAEAMCAVAAGGAARVVPASSVVLGSAALLFVLAAGVLVASRSHGGHGAAVSQRTRAARRVPAAGAPCTARGARWETCGLGSR